MRLLSILTVALLAFIPLAAPAAEAPARESAYDRVMRTGTLRCGYINYPPHFKIDPASGQKSGISYEIANEMGRLLNLKIEWAEEVGWATTVESIKSGRVDAICTSFWQNPVEGRYLGFTLPLFYSPVGAYKRADHPHPETLDDINRPEIRVASSDGAISYFIQQQDYPKTTTHSLPNMTDETQLLLEVSTGKADVTFVETYLGEKFNAANQNILVNIAVNPPLRLFGNTFAIPFDDYRFKSMLDSALVQMLQGTFVANVLKKYEEVPGGIYRVARPYEVPIP